MVSATVKDNWLFTFQVLVYFHEAMNCWLKDPLQRKGQIYHTKERDKKVGTNFECILLAREVQLCIEDNKIVISCRRNEDRLSCPARYVETHPVYKK